MMVSFLQHTEIDKKRWDDCLQDSPQSLLYGLSGYLDLVSPQWSALVEKNDQQYLTVLPLSHVSLYGFEVLRQPLFAQQLGVFSLNTTISDDFITILENFFLKSSYISPYQFNTHFTELPFFQNPHFRVHHCHTHHLDLRQPYAQILKNMSVDRRKNLKKAYKTDWELENSLDIEPLIHFFQTTAAGRIEGGVSPKAYDLLRKIYLFLQEKGIAKLYYAKKDGERQAGVLLAFWKNTIIYLFNANCPNTHRLNGRLWILDQIFKQYAEQDWIFDFESPEIPSIAYFYESFGAKAVPYPQLWYNRLPFWAEGLRRLKQYFYQSSIA